MKGLPPRVPGLLGWLVLALFILSFIAIGVAGIAGGMVVVNRQSAALGRAVLFFVIGMVLLYGGAALYYWGLRRHGLLPSRTAQERAEVRARSRSAIPWIALQSVATLTGLALVVILALNVPGREGLFFGGVVMGVALMVAVLAQVEASRRLKRPLLGGLKPRTVRLVIVIWGGICVALGVTALITQRMAH